MKEDILLPFISCNPGIALLLPLYVAPGLAKKTCLSSYMTLTFRFQDSYTRLSACSVVIK